MSRQRAWTPHVIVGRLRNRNRLAPTRHALRIDHECSSASQVVSADAHILYDKAHGALYYDTNGGTGAGRVQFAILDNHATLTFQDFVVA